MIVASIWPILAAIFIVSALLKLVHKLIKEERVPNLQQQQQPQQQDQQAQQQQQQPQQPQVGSEPLSSQFNHLSAHLWQSEHHLNHLHTTDYQRQQQQLLFRHQNGRPADLDSITIDDNELVETESHFHHHHQHPAPNQQQQQQQQQQQDQQTSDTCSQASNWSSGSNRCRHRNYLQTSHESRRSNNNITTDEEDDNNSSSRSSNNSSRSSSISASKVIIKQQQTTEASPQQLATALALITELYLLEPAKFFLSVFTTSVGLFWRLLDAIEGIEGIESSSISSGVQVTTGQLSERSQQQQRSLARQARRSNYFHRRYRSRRSLSAALLDDLDWSQDPIEGEELVD